ncbi:hypothetical protein CN931_00470 [Bacillus sp. AFS054943]|uniref:Uncharacterized protein n=1 Tax=Bacillus cereus TaxID=1396 RepID=A0A2C1LFC4_BACCE|nr:hypothetical protein CN476_12230 [Bacillus cereus]PFA63716.1 hypothetical protein CN402_06665 [Bacillus sp. AFS015896]PGL88059.1 hypothetical protein CN931_00470 [Bacillus sp. AFS054943]PGX02635.1 hypothetical protein COE07_23895 [Bacillus sp. AFS033286]PGZ76630.1 hypothetical protein COE49_01130 [Bacillus sp. AFS029637]
MKFLSAIFQIYRPQLQIYRRFSNYIDHNSKYIGDSTRNIDLPTKNDNKNRLLHKRNSPLLSLFL